jgi:hypothetical protein
MALLLAVPMCAACTSLLGDFSIGDGSGGSAGGATSGGGTAGAGGTSGTAGAGGAGGGSGNPCPTRCNSGMVDCGCDGTCDDILAGDPNRCGSCTAQCENGVCLPGNVCQPIVIATAESPVAGIVSDGETVFWVEEGDLALATGRIMAMPTDLSAGSTQLADLQGAPQSIVAYQQYVYWTNRNPVVGVWRAQKSMPSTPMKVSGNEIGSQTGLATDMTSLFWTNQLLDTVSRADLPNGGTVATIAAMQDEPYSVAVDGTHVYWVNRADSVPGVGAVVRALKDGTDRVVLAESQEDPRHIAVDSDNVYWACGFGLTVYRLPLAGGGNPVVVGDSAAPSAVVAAGDYIYWTDSGANEFYRVPRDGGGPVVVIETDSPTNTIAMDATHIYIGSDMSLYRIRR